MHVCFFHHSWWAKNFLSGFAGQENGNLPFVIDVEVFAFEIRCLSSSLGLASSPLTPHTTASVNNAVVTAHPPVLTDHFGSPRCAFGSHAGGFAPTRMVGTRTRQVLQRTGPATPEVHRKLECLLFDARHDPQQGRS